ncbi:unnamed protein product [Effrenium voratum]|nr:unnamed protein product [Effrenium voratum]CAJ1449091.1 unnamed protein product [Effrenium voratum]
MADPVASAEMYGLPLQAKDKALTWVIVAGLRDFSLGVSTLALFFYQPAALKIFAPCTLLVAAGDAAITWGGPFPAPWTHLVGVSGIAALSAAAWLDADPEAYQKL